MLVYNIINEYLCNMEMPYNFLGLIDKLYTLFKNALDYSADKYNILGFLLFVLLIVAGFPLVGVITAPLWVLGAIEHLFFTIMDYLDEVGDENKFKSFMAYTGIIMMIIPTLTFFGPGLIWNKIKKHRVKKREERTRLTLEQINNEIRHWCAPPHFNIKRVEDFKPKHRLKAHTFIEKRKERFISPGVYIQDNMFTASGYNSIAIGYENTYTQQPNRIRYE